MCTLHHPDHSHQARQIEMKTKTRISFIEYMFISVHVRNIISYVRKDTVMYETIHVRNIPNPFIMTL